jgi:hypothetical protein
MKFMSRRWYPLRTPWKSADGTNSSAPTASPIAGSSGGWARGCWAAASGAPADGAVAHCAGCRGPPAGASGAGAVAPSPMPAVLWLNAPTTSYLESYLAVHSASMPRCSSVISARGGWSTSASTIDASALQAVTSRVAGGRTGRGENEEGGTGGGTAWRHARPDGGKESPHRTCVEQASHGGGIQPPRGHCHCAEGCHAGGDDSGGGGSSGNAHVRSGGDIVDLATERDERPVRAYRHGSA